MKMLLIPLGILLVLLALSQVRLWVRVRYGREGLALWLGLGPIRRQVYPRRPKRAAKVKAQADKPDKKTAGGSVLPIRKMIPVVGEAAGRLRRRIQVDQILLEVTAAGGDPARAALAFGGVNALIGMILPVLEHNFTVKKRDIRTAVDFQQSEPTVYLLAQLSLRVGQAVAFALWLLLRLAKEQEGTRKPGRSKSQKEAV